MTELHQKKSVNDFWPVKNKKVLVRVDFNVPIKDGVIRNDLRIRAALPTVQAITSQGGSVILMSHLGRPAGVKYDKLKGNEEARRYFLETWAAENGTGRTSFFACLSGAEKKQVLDWSSLAMEAIELSEGPGSGKTQLFSKLPKDEKMELLNRLTKERSTAQQQETQFPYLRKYQGFEEELSLRPVANRLQELLQARDGTNCPPVLFAEDCLNADREVGQLQPGQVLLLENVRFYKDESSKNEQDRLQMASKIATYGDYFVSDAFGTAHRNSATMTGLPKILGHGAAGYLMAREVTAFCKVLQQPPRPLVAIVGGAKVSDKILLLENLMTKIDILLIGGAMAYTFLKAKGFNIGRSFSQAGQSFTDKYSGEQLDIVQLAARLLKTAEDKGIDVCLPVDHVCHTACEPTDNAITTQDANVPADYMALDIGPKTIEQYRNKIRACKAAIWNGPMGVFEIPAYSSGTFAIAKAMGDETEQRNMLTIIGGGDSASAAEQSGQASRMSHVSTGGGASLELLEGKECPGIAVLDNMQ